MSIIIEKLVFFAATPINSATGLTLEQILIMVTAGGSILTGIATIWLAAESRKQSRRALKTEWKRTIQATAAEFLGGCESIRLFKITNHYIPIELAGAVIANQKKLLLLIGDGDVAQRAEVLRVSADRAQQIPHAQIQRAEDDFVAAINQVILEDDD